MATAFPRVYRSFGEFERKELRKLDHLYESVNTMLDELLMEELCAQDRRREEGILFDDIDMLLAEEC